MKIQWKKIDHLHNHPACSRRSLCLSHKRRHPGFEWINKPPLSPPAWLFPVAWTILYVLMGIASYLVLVNENNRGPALTVYGIQLFSTLSGLSSSLTWKLICWHLYGCQRCGSSSSSQPFSSKISKAAALLLIPYILWVAFAGYLNFGIYLFELISVSTEHLAYKITFPGDLHRNDRREFCKKSVPHINGIILLYLYLKT